MMTKKENVLGKRVSELCMKKRVSYYMLATDAGIPLTTLLHITDGTTRNPGIYTVMKICNALSVPLADFVTGLEEETET